MRGLVLLVVLFGLVMTVVLIVGTVVVIYTLVINRVPRNCPRCGDRVVYTGELRNKWIGEAPQQEALYRCRSCRFKKWINYG